MKSPKPQPKDHRDGQQAVAEIMWACLVVLVGFTACVATVQAQNVDPMQANQIEANTPWTPDVIQAVDPYFGSSGLDHFAGPNSADQVGGITTPLSNGDRLVAGLVPNYGQSNAANGMWNIGLVRYNQAGRRVPWTAPGANGFFGNQYVVYPNSDTPLYQYIRDVKVQNGIIYVLVDEQNSSQTGLGRQNVRIVAFREDGSFHSQWPTFGFPASGGTDDVDFYGAQMVPISSTRMIVAATAYDSLGPFVAVTRLDILSNGAVSLDNAWGNPYGGTNSLNRWTTYSAPASYCGQPSFCDVTAGYATKAIGYSSPDFYVAGSIHINGDDWDQITLKVSSETGAEKTEFNDTGWSRAVFNDTNSSMKDIAAGLYVYQDEVYVAAQVARKCHDGIGLAKLNGATGDYINAFGGGGTVIFGGQGNATFCFAGPNQDTPWAISATGGRIGVVGDSVRTVIETAVDPMLAVVDAVNGSVLDFASHPVTRPDGSRAGDAILYSVFGGPSPSSPFTAAGNGRDTNAGNTLSYLTGKFFPLSGDRIFASNMGGDP